MAFRSPFVEQRVYLLTLADANEHAHPFTSKHKQLKEGTDAQNLRKRTAGPKHARCISVELSLYAAIAILFQSFFSQLASLLKKKKKEKEEVHARVTRMQPT